MAVTLEQAQVLRNQAVDLARTLGIENAVKNIVWSTPVTYRQGDTMVRPFDGDIALVLRASTGGTRETRVDLKGPDFLAQPVVTVYLAQDQGRDVQVFHPGRWIDHLLAWAEEVRAELERQRLEREAEQAAELVEAFSPLDDWQPSADALAPEF